MKIVLNSKLLELTPKGKGYLAVWDEQSAVVEILSTTNGELRLLIAGKPVTATVSSDGAQRWVTINGQTFLLTKSAEATRRGGHAHHAAGELVAPMPGQVRAVNVSAGDAVTKGQTLVIVEAMKMEIKVVAPRDGIVANVLVKVGDTVEREQILIQVESQTSNV